MSSFNGTEGCHPGISSQFNTGKEEMKFQGSLILKYILIKN